MTTQRDLDAYLRHMPSGYRPKGDEDSFLSEGGLNHPEPLGTREMLELRNEDWHMMHDPTEEHRPASEHRPTPEESRLLGAVSGGLMHKRRPAEPLPQGGRFVSAVREFSVQADEGSWSLTPQQESEMSRDVWQMQSRGETDAIDPEYGFTGVSGDPASRMLGLSRDAR